MGEGTGSIGNYLFGDGLKPRRKYVSMDYVLSDGPFIEAKEAVNGYFFMHAKDLDHAVAMAQSCSPHGKDVKHGN
jgi:hypothetical protein